MSPERPPQQVFIDPQPRPFEPAAVSRIQRELSPGWLQDQSGERYPLYLGVTQIGRAIDQDIRPSEGSVSRQHAIIRYERYPRGEAFIFQAVGQAETTLNDVRVGLDPKQLYDGDRIRLGTVIYTFFIKARR
jgi:predicted component of type VI protein secretion system